MSAREDLAAAVNTVEGVNVTATRRQNLAPLQGFVTRSRRVKPPNGLGWMDTWQIWIALPQDTAMADGWVDDHLDALLSSLRRELIVGSAFLAELQPVPGAPVVPGLVIEGAREG